MIGEALAMAKVLDVRRVGFAHDLGSDTRSPESFAFPACLTSLVESLGGDVGWRTIEAHGREWTERFAYKDYLVATGMAFGLLWHPEHCLSSADLSQVNAEHNDTIRRGFDYAGRRNEIVEKSEGNAALLRDRIVANIDAGRPVLAFGIVGPPECGIICGYDQDGEVLLGWSHFHTDGMFRESAWLSGLWKIVLCGEPKAPVRDLKNIVEHGLSIMDMQEVGGYEAGVAAYDAWIAHVSDKSCESMDDGALRHWHELHHLLVGNHAEARAYLSNFLAQRGAGQPQLEQAAGHFMNIHDTCWRVWDVLGGLGAPDGHLGLRDPAKRDELAAMLGSIRDLDLLAADALRAWLAHS
jgi:hypothetical protein